MQTHRIGTARLCGALHPLYLYLEFRASTQSGSRANREADGDGFAPEKLSSFGHPDDGYLVSAGVMVEKLGHQAC